MRASQLRTATGDIRIAVSRSASTAPSATEPDASFSVSGTPVRRLVSVSHRKAQSIMPGVSRGAHELPLAESPRSNGFSERLEHALVRIERFVGNERLGFKLWEQGIGSGQIVLLTAGEMKADRIAECIDGGVNFGAQPSARAPDGLILTPFLRAPALCWWARTMVGSIIAYSLSASSDRWLKSLSQSPLFAHRLNRVWIVSGSPTRSGKSRHAMPSR